MRERKQKLPKQKLTDEDTVARWDALQRNVEVWLYREGALASDKPVRITFSSLEMLSYGDPEELDAGRADPVDIWADFAGVPSRGWQIRRL